MQFWHPSWVERFRQQGKARSSVRTENQTEGRTTSQEYSTSSFFAAHKNAALPGEDGNEPCLREQPASSPPSHKA